MKVAAWQVQDSGLVAAPGPFRRLAGAVRHHRGQGPPWPDRVVLEVADGRLVVTGADGGAVGSWPLAEATVRNVTPGPPVSFILQLPGVSRLLAAPAGPATDTLLAALR